MYIRNKSKRKLQSIGAVFLAIVMLLTSVPELGATVASAAEKAQATVTTQDALMKALTNQKVRKITIKTEKAVSFDLPSKDYKSKTLVINAAKASVTNSARLKKMIVHNVKSITEKAIGNSVLIYGKKVAYKAAKGSKVKNITYESKNAKSVISVYGTIEEIIIAKKADISIKGSRSGKIPVRIKKTAKNSSVIASVPVNIILAADANILLKPGAEGSKVTSTNQDVKPMVSNQTKKKVEYHTPRGKKYIKAQTIMTSRGEQKKVTEDTEISKTTRPTMTPDKSDIEPIKVPTKIPTKTPDNIQSYPAQKVFYRVSFETNGGTQIDPVTVAGGEKIENLPVPQRSNSIFLGWYTDKSYQNSFSENTSVYSNTTLYARYSEIETDQQNLNDTFTLTDQEPGLAIPIISSDTAMSAEGVTAGITLVAVDGSEDATLTATGSNGSYVITVQGGFTEGTSYHLTLSDDKLSFKDKEDTVRKCAITIKKEEVYNIALNDGIIYIPNNTVENMTKNGEQIKSLSVPIVGLGDNKNTEEEVMGTFIYKGDTVLNRGDVLCIYSGNKPVAPKNAAEDASYLNDDIAYIKVVTVTGNIGSQQVQYSDAEAKEVIFKPDVLPIAVGGDHELQNYVAATTDTEGSFSVAEKDLHFASYQDMGLTENTTIDRRDFLAFYSGNSPKESNADQVSFGEVTNVKEDNGIIKITFITTTEQKMQEGLDYYSKNDVDADTLLQDIDVASVECEMEEQVKESGFAENASLYMTAMALETDGFKKFLKGDANIRSLSIKMEDGTDASIDDVKLMSFAASGSKVQIQNLKVDANIGKGLYKLSGSGLRCTVGVSFDVSVKTGDNSVIKISLSATFVEELKLDVGTSSKIIWKKKWIFIYPGDYQVSANIDVYTYTGINFKAVVSSKSTSIDISKQIQKILTSSKKEEISGGVKELFDLYTGMMQNETDWIKIIDKNITTINQRLCLGIIHIRTSVNFVVSANINVALGCNFEYQNGNRYIFWAKLGARDAGSNTVKLMDEKYNFEFYVMGTLGLRAGIHLEFGVGLCSVTLNSLGLTADVGVYTKLYGYFYYQLESINSLKKSKMSGAMYLNFGIYLEITFKAQVLNGKYQYNPTLYANEWPLLSAGSPYYVYDFSYDNSIATIRLKDKERTKPLPYTYFYMCCRNILNGSVDKRTYIINNFDITFTNSNFSFYSNNIFDNNIKVNVPSGTRKLESDMTITWKGGPFAFSSIPISRTFHVVWDDVNDNGYTISFQSNYGSTVSSITRQYGTVITEPSAPTRLGFTFGGWYNRNMTTAFNFKTMPAENMILYAKWIPDTNTPYKIEQYHQNLVNDNYTLYETENLTGTTEDFLVAKPKSYQGFTYVSNTKDSRSSIFVLGDGSSTLKLYYKRNNYTLIFLPDNGTANIVKKLKYGAEVSEPTVIKTGFAFLGWSNKVVSTMPAENVTYIAVWNPKIYRIEFNSNGGSEVNQITAAYTTAISAPAAPVKEGYLFEGWYRDSKLTTPYTITTMPAENLILYAKWKQSIPIAYQVEYYLQTVSGGGYTLESTENLIGKINTTVTAKEKTYHGFYYNKTADGTVSSGIITADQPLVLKLYYDRNSYTITFLPSNGDEAIVQTLKYGASVTAPKVNKVGYTFKGWDKELVTTMSAENITYMAQWEINNYTIKFITDGGTEIPTMVSAYHNKVTPPVPPQKTGYEFDGWYKDEDFTINYEFDTMSAENIILYAKWMPLNTEYKVEHYQQNLEGNGYTLQDSVTLSGETDEMAEASVQDYEGFTYNSQVPGSLSSGKITPDHSLVLKFYYDRNSYNVTFKLNNGDSDIVKAQKYGATVTIPEEPKKTGYIFGGWYRDENFMMSYELLVMPAEDIVLYAKWKSAQSASYKVEYYQQNLSDSGYTLKDSVTLNGNIGKKVEASVNQYEGFTYNYGAAGSVPFGEIAADHSLVLKCYYDRNSYTVTYKLNNGENDIVKNLQYGVLVSELEEPHKTDYIFNGWYRDENFMISYVFGTMPAENIVLYAKWKSLVAAEYKVEHYQKNQGDNTYTLVDTETFTGEIGEIVEASVKQYEGFTYNMEVDGSVPFGTVKADNSLVLKYYYDRNSDTVTLQPDNGGNDIVK